MALVDTFQRTVLLQAYLSIVFRFSRIDLAVIGMICRMWK